MRARRNLKSFVPLIGLVVVFYVVFRAMAAPHSTQALVLYKLGLGILAAVVGHIVVKVLYPYIDIEKMLVDDKKNEGADATKFLAVCILRGVVMAALILGVLLGI